jgi:hypothetical protein
VDKRHSSLAHTYVYRFYVRTRSSKVRRSCPKRWRTYQYVREPREVAEARIDEADRSYAYGQAPALRVSLGNHSNG